MARLAIHPGDQLTEELKALGISAAELARQLKVPTNRVTGILNGQRAITGDTALRLAHFFGTSPEFWLNLQSRYDMDVNRRSVREAGGARGTTLKGCRLKPYSQITSCSPDRSPKSPSAGHSRFLPLISSPHQSQRASVCGCAISRAIECDIRRAVGRAEPARGRGCDTNDRD